MSLPKADRLTVLYLAPWVDLGGSDRNTVDLARWLDRDRYRLIVATTQESRNRRLPEIARYAEEVWPLTEIVPGGRMPSLLMDIVAARGVDIVHIMNSRIGFQLLPDLSALPEPPGVLVQLHVEEADRSGYVRYVTTRYGNLVDQWSVSSRHLAGIVEDYGVLADRINVIYTGIDAEREFNPDLATPVSLEPDAFHVLYLGRWVDQKDPLLMLEIAEGLVARHPNVRVHAVGEGELEGMMRERIAACGLERHVLLHPTTSDVQSWLSACDVLLMTSVYEGLPLVLFEAMAMGAPSVAPALPANLELMGDAAGVLVSPRDDVEAYVAALSDLIRNPDRVTAIGASARERVRAGFGLREMADQHGALYDSIAAERRARRARHEGQETSDPAARSIDNGEERVEPLPPLRFRSRPVGEQPLVSIVVPCFEHGRWLPEALASIAAQDYPAIQTIVVDDHSRDAKTRALLDELETGSEVEVVRMPVNGGPSRARNAGLARVRGRYVLPVDADNILLPDAVTNLVAQLASAGELVGFIYPNQQFFGNRKDNAKAPAWNPYLLLEGNFCDTCSLYDVQLFDAGLRYPEDIVLGHEDWDLALTLAEAGVRGEPARVPTVLVRKHGFTRSDLVEHSATPFAERVKRRHPEMFGSTGGLGRFGPYAGPAARLKARWSPFLSIIGLSEIATRSEEGRRLIGRAMTQTAGDAELLLPYTGGWPDADRGPWVRRLPPGSAELPEGRLGAGLAMARGQVVLATTGTGSALLADPAWIEKIGLLFEDDAVDALALIEATDDEIVRFAVVPDPPAGARPHALAWRTAGSWLPEHLGVRPEDELGSIARALTRGGARLHWRAAVEPRSESLPLPRMRTLRRPKAITRRTGAALPARGETVRNLEPGSWHPPLTTTLARHRRIGSEERHISTITTPPPGFELDHLLGAAQLFTPPGTAQLHATSGGSFLTDALPEAAALVGEADRYLGSLELIGFLGLDALLLGVMYSTGQHVLVAGRDDPLLGMVEVRAELGFLEPLPLRPRDISSAGSTFGLVGLCRSLDLEARRHRYAVGRMPAGRPVGELGALHVEPQEGSVPLWITSDDLVVGSPASMSASVPDLRQLARWVGAPVGWRRFGHHSARVRSVMRRAQEARALTRHVAGSTPRAFGGPAGYGHSMPAPGRVPLYTARHPITNDRLLTRFPLEAQDMGYVETTLLAWLNDRGPVTGEVTLARATVPWASRYGLEARWA
jgi:glycosyltransferase involved in cell wall biosynthesis